jgi:hypothetical protein
MLIFLAKINSNKLLNLLFRIRYLIITRKEDWVLGRVACLGIKSLAHLNIKSKIYNLNKCRMDFLHQSFQTKQNNIRPSLKLLNTIKRKDIQKIIPHQFFAFFDFKKPPKYLTMDASSDMTDFKFTDTYNPDSFFFVNYSDIENNQRANLISEGLMPLNENLSNLYIDFFTNFRNRFPNCPIIYLHYPYKFEKRKKILDRHFFIRETIHNISPKFNNFHLVDIPEEVVFLSEDNDGLNPYDFHPDVYFRFADEIKNILKKSIVKTT